MAHNDRNHSISVSICNRVVVYNHSEKERRHRRYVHDTIECVVHSVNVWSRVFSRDAPDLCFPDSGSCADLARYVKSYLGQDVGGDLPSSLSFNLIKKRLPGSCKCMEGSLIDTLLEKIQSPPPLLPRNYLLFVRKEVKALFKPGWDRRYEQYCAAVDPPLKSCTESGRSTFGQAGLLIENDSETGINYTRGSIFDCHGPQDQAEFLDATLTGRGMEPKSDQQICLERGLQYDPNDVLETNEPPRLFSKKAVLKVVQSSGKPRALTVFSSETLVLKPLHKMIYSYLAKQPWLLKGSPRDDLFDAFDKSSGLVLTSGDYKSATDNLHISVAEAILDEILKTTRHVPTEVMDYAMRILRPTLQRLVKHDCARGQSPALCHAGECPKEDLIDLGEPMRGQMMGSLLSFPLLCLQNFLALRWAEKKSGESVRAVRINGDDILFQSTPRFSRLWMDIVVELGLEVERSKTSVLENEGTINSTPLRYDNKGILRVLPVLRIGMLRLPEFANSLSDNFRDFVNGIPRKERAMRHAASVCFFLNFKQYLSDLPYTLQELGFRASSLARVPKCVLRDDEVKRLRIRTRSDPVHCIRKMPSPPTIHNILLDSEDIVMVPESLFAEADVRDFNRREMIAWKWAKCRKLTKTRALLSYYIRLGSAWPDSTDVVDAISIAMTDYDDVLRPKRSGDGSWQSFARLETPRDERLKPLMRSVYDSAAPPDYTPRSEEVGHLVDVDCQWMKQIE